MLSKSVSTVRLRFPPSPTGELHLGSARTALYNFLFASQHGGQLIFRIEDTDQARYVPGAMNRFIEDLKWLGIEWDEGPDIGGPHAPYVQSERLDRYQAAAHALLEKGVAYRCYCSPERLEAMRAAQTARKEPPRYDRHCLREGVHLDGQPSVIRFQIPDGVTHLHDLIRGEVTVVNSVLDDFILLKSDGFPTYHLANVVDDHAMGISHVIRGEEWLPSTPKHLLLYQAFRWLPPAFAHLPLILAIDKKKLSKRLHGETVWVATYRKQGYLPEALLNYLALLGWNPGDDLPASSAEREFFSLEELTHVFSIERVHKAGAIFDPEKLKFMNGHYLRQLAAAAIVTKLREGEFLSPEFSRFDNRTLERWVTITRERMTTLSGFEALIWPIVALADYPAARLIFKKSDSERTRQGLASASALLAAASAEDWQTVASLQRILEKAVTNDLTNGDVFWPVRVALSGLDASPAPAELLWVLGKEESLRRIALARELIELER